MLMTNPERRLCQILRDLPYEHGLRYTKDSHGALQKALFRSLVAENDDYLRVLFQGRVPKPGEEWNLRKAQGMAEDMEYTEVARGKPCGHIFKSGDSVYRCKTCTLDETAVLCIRCYEASDHTGHIVSQSISSGNSGCCDCGDDEAWKIPVKCGIHTANSSAAAGKKPQRSILPEGLAESIRMTIGRALDYLVDVISCSPENLRLVKNKASIRQDEEQARLESAWYTDRNDKHPEFALVLWNDEKHTVSEVENQVARACKKSLLFGLRKANEVNDMGRSAIEYSWDLEDLLKIATVVEQIKLTTTIRSSRDTFREQMCGTIIEWLGDIAGCAVGEDCDILQLTVCQEFLKPWRLGSEASNKHVGMRGLDDHEIDEAAELQGSIRNQAARRGALAGPWRRLQADSDADAIANDDENDDGDDEADSQFGGDEMGLEDMDLDTILQERSETINRDVDMRIAGELEADELEVSEATFAGYPPPPPPPPAPRPADPPRTFSASEDISNTDVNSSASFPMTGGMAVPQTSWSSHKRSQARPPSYWLEQPERCLSRDALPLEDDLRQRVRLDWLLLYDLRLWKSIRIGLRDLYINTVVSIPSFKRVLGLRFAGLYSVLAQLYMIADREPDYSITNLSVQTFTTPSITQELVERGNFLTTLLSILYTFLTKRTVRYPWQVSVDDTLAFEHGSVANRRMYHFFTDLKHLFSIQYVQEELRNRERYVLQFLDLIKLPQGTCPNVRAVGEHVEYENDIWIGAQLLTQEINRLCRQFGETFKWDGSGDNSSIVRVLRTVAKAAIVNSTGAERVRFNQAEIKAETRFKRLMPFFFENDEDSPHLVVDFVVERESISFHHALHYTLSWLIESAKTMTREELYNLLHFTFRDLKQATPFRALIPDFKPEEYMMAFFDFPLRVCAWLAQMKAGMWVRNGLSLRHQMITYRSVSHRELAHHRDIFLLQTAMVTCNPSRVLASMIDRFGMNEWMRGNYSIRPGYEPIQQLDVAEEFIHFLIVLLSDRASLIPPESGSNAQALAIRRNIAHILCFKPLSFSDLNTKFADRSTDLEEFQDILEEMTTYRSPEGLSDTGIFELKQEYLADIDPYIAQYTKNQRDEAENAYRIWMAKRTGKPVADIVFEPKLPPIEFGVFTDLAAFTRTPLFAQIIFYSLAHHLHPELPTETPVTRLEAYLQVVLHLMLAAVIEDNTNDDNEVDMDGSKRSFIDYTMNKTSELGITIFEILIKLLENEEIKACHPKIRLILYRIRQRQPSVYNNAVSRLYYQTRRPPALPIERLGFESPRTPQDEDQEAKQRQARDLKKRQALDKQLKLFSDMRQQQISFANNQGIADLDVDDVDDLESVRTGATEEHRRTWKYPMGNCILCREETNDGQLFGTLALMTESNLFRQTDIRDPDSLGEVLSTPPNLDRSADKIRPFGVASQNITMVKKRGPDGYEFNTEQQGLGKGFLPSFCHRGPVSSGCGHIMHYSCFEHFCAATQRRHNQQIARNHPERLDLKEFVCPLCKALGNAFLPIIWRGKEELYPGVLHTETSFNEWVSSGVALTVSRFFKSEEGRPRINRRHELFITYASKTVIPPLASRLTSLIQSPLSHPTSPHSSTPNLMPGMFPFPDDAMSPSRPISVEPSLTEELITVYKRLLDTVKANGLYSSFRSDVTIPGRLEDLTHTDVLASALGHSIAAAEIVQRGVQSDYEHTLLDKIPTSVMTHLRILSETASSYVAIGGIRNFGDNSAIFESLETTNEQIVQLLTGHPQIGGICQDTNPALPRRSALSCDSFVLLAECSVSLAPTLSLDIHHLTRLCYLLEIVKAALYLSTSVETFATCRDKLLERRAAKVCVSDEDLQALHIFLSRLSAFSTPHWPMLTLQTPEYHSLLWKAISTYALTFLRKAAILLNVRYGVDYPDTELAEPYESELDRITKNLRLPTLNTMFASLGDSKSSGPTTLEAIVTGWIQHWQYDHDHQEKMPTLSEGHRVLKECAFETLRPGHPAIFELIGLPKYFDNLTYEVTRRRCPTTGNKMEDPALCLFCGDIFCSQALCCAKNNEGGCNQHMKKCGIDIGLYLNIRKCCVLYLHNRNGSWSLAPYLDKYGESDPGLRRGRPLILNQKRYDALLRNAWLSQGIPTVIARKLEGENNSGGWETL